MQNFAAIGPERGGQIDPPPSKNLLSKSSVKIGLSNKGGRSNFKDPSRSKTWNRQIIYLRKAVFSLNITIQAWSAFIACEMNKSIPTLTVEGLENGQTERRNTALRGVKIYDIMSCRIPACMIQVCIRKVAFFFLLDFEVMIRVFKYITIKYTVFKRIILHLTLLQKWKPELQLLIV